MRPADEFTLDALGAERTGQAVLLRRGARIGSVPASQIDAQFAASGGHLVLLSYGDLFSALETILFVGPDGAIRDRVTLGHATEQGLITEIRPEGDDAVSFAFPGDERRRVRVARRREWFGLRKRWLQVD